MNPSVFEVTFIAGVLPEYANYGISGYVIGNGRFRSLTSLKNALDTAFEKDLGTYRALEAQIVFGTGTERKQVVCTSDNYNDVLIAIESELNYTKMTLDELLAEE